MTGPRPKLPPVSLNISTAGDLALACSAKPVSPGNAALLNFCNGFAQRVVQTERLNPSGSKICLPTPAPKRSETMKGIRHGRCCPPEGGCEYELHWLHVGTLSLQQVASDWPGFRSLLRPEFLSQCQCRARVCAGWVANCRSHPASKQKVVTLMRRDLTSGIP